MPFRGDSQLTSLANDLDGFQIHSSGSKAAMRPERRALHDQSKLSVSSKRLSLNVPLDPQFSSKIPTRSPSSKSLKLIDSPHADNSRLPVAKRYYSDSKHAHRKAFANPPSGLPSSKSMHHISLHTSSAPSYLNPTLSSLSRSRHEKENVPLQRRQSMKQAPARGMVSSSSVADLQILKKPDRKPGNNRPQIAPAHRISSTPSSRLRRRRISSEEELHKLMETSSRFASQFRQVLHYAFQGRHEKLPHSPQDLATADPGMYQQLTVYERGEILRKREIYFTGERSVKARVDSQNYSCNFGFDDEKKDYRCAVGDHINYRYEILAKLGKGSFGSVICAKDHKTQQLVAIKIVKNEMDWSVQAMSEIKCMKSLSGRSPNIVQYFEHFHFRSHICIVTELLLINLYELIELSGFRGLSLGLLKKFGKNILHGLRFIHEQNLIHCDMKPENLMLAYNHQLGFHVKVIDFGSSCEQGRPTFSYLQSRFYRAPEVCLGARYNHKIDIWSFGAIMAELYTGTPIFYAKDEYELVDFFISYFGPPPRGYILELRTQLLKEGPIINLNRPSTNSLNFRTLLWRAFNDDGSLNTSYLHSKKSGCKFKPSSCSLSRQLARYCTEPGTTFEHFVEMLSGCLTWSHHRRLDCDKLLSVHFYH
ncbi:hypothetical protein KL942_001435 [Ogataea angusta]|uniref:Protein kinase domain-containing protein n=1 Tax=Pichia angusta TaxID=870730 RepID=A0ABQ7S0U2_PICAN|nr:hypothetical protein KL942_001435 [Ogataea angusta]KAG7850867.1 hypothetical protein KL940_001444 [Ogataea angusta]